MMEDAQGSKYPPHSKKLVIFMDPIDGSISYNNEDSLTYSEALGMMEYAKMLITRIFLEETS